jgi:hypothetical protein
VRRRERADEVLGREAVDPSSSRRRRRRTARAPCSAAQHA